MAINLDPQWLSFLAPEFNKPYMQALKQFLVAEKQAGKMIFPKGDEIFAAFNLTPFNRVRVVILGQDPYHGEGQAHGLCFSVKPGVAKPPSLVNIYKELLADLNIAPPSHGSLVAWAQDGVLLLNSVLTVERSLAGSHQNRGWETFTDRVIEVLNQGKENLVFILWGAYAERKGAKIDTTRHLVLRAPHPSPLSSHRGFFGSRPFSKTNAYLTSKGLPPIRWAVEDALPPFPI